MVHSFVCTIVIRSSFHPQWTVTTLFFHYSPHFMMMMRAEETKKFFFGSAYKYTRCIIKYNTFILCIKGKCWETIFWFYWCELFVCCVHLYLCILFVLLAFYTIRYMHRFPLSNEMQSHFSLELAHIFQVFSYFFCRGGWIKNICFECWLSQRIKQITSK